jgi:hypothetical protein
MNKTSISIFIFSLLTSIPLMVLGMDDKSNAPALPIVHFYNKVLLAEQDLKKGGCCRFAIVDKKWFFQLVNPDFSSASSKPIPIAPPSAEMQISLTSKDNQKNIAQLNEKYYRILKEDTVLSLPHVLPYNNHHPIMGQFYKKNDENGYSLLLANNTISDDTLSIPTTDQLQTGRILQTVGDRLIVGIAEPNSTTGYTQIIALLTRSKYYESVQESASILAYKPLGKYSYQCIRLESDKNAEAINENQKKTTEQFLYLSAPECTSIPPASKPIYLAHSCEWLASKLYEVKFTIAGIEFVRILQFSRDIEDNESYYLNISDINHDTYVCFFHPEFYSESILSSDNFQAPAKELLETILPGVKGSVIAHIADSELSSYFLPIYSGTVTITPKPGSDRRNTSFSPKLANLTLEAPTITIPVIFNTTTLPFLQHGKPLILQIDGKNTAVVRYTLVEEKKLADQNSSTNRPKNTSIGIPIGRLVKFFFNNGRYLIGSVAFAAFLGFCMHACKNASTITTP